MYVCLLHRNYTAPSIPSEILGLLVSKNIHDISSIFLDMLLNYSIWEILLY